jgi:hypothetical protein
LWWAVRFSPGLDDVFEVFDIVFGEEDNVLSQFGGWVVVVGAEAAAHREHFDGALIEKVLVFTEHFGHVFQWVQSRVAISHGLGYHFGQAAR